MSNGPADRSGGDGDSRWSPRRIFISGLILLFFLAAAGILLSVGFMLRDCRNLQPRLSRVRSAIAEVDSAAANLVFQEFSSADVERFAASLETLDDVFPGVEWPEPFCVVHEDLMLRMDSLARRIGDLEAAGSVPPGQSLIEAHYRTGSGGTDLAAIVDELLSFLVHGYSGYSASMVNVRQALDRQQMTAFRRTNYAVGFVAAGLLLGVIGLVMARLSRARRESRNLEEAAEEQRLRLDEARDLLMEREKTASLSMMFAGMVHDVNTPLGVCVTGVSRLDMMAAEAAGGTLDAAEVSDITSLVRSNLDRAVNLVRGFKNVSADGVGEQKRPFELISYISGDLAPSLEPALKSRRHRLRVDVPEDAVMLNSPGEIAQVVTNLVMNASLHAYDAGEAGTIVLSVRRGDGKVEIAVSDEGKGMDEDTAARIWDPFFTTMRGKGGTGLGLAVVWNTVRIKLRGDIRCESTPGKGTVFTVTLPVPDPGDEPP